MARPKKKQRNKEPIDPMDRLVLGLVPVAEGADDLLKQLQVERLRKEALEQEVEMLRGQQATAPLSVRQARELVTSLEGRAERLEVEVGLHQRRNKKLEQALSAALAGCPMQHACDWRGEAEALLQAPMTEEDDEATE